MELKDLSELMSREEPLLDELRPFVQQDGPLGPMLHHPLLIDMTLDENRCGLINARYLHRREAITRLVVERDFMGYVFQHERGYRFDALYKAAYVYGLTDGEPKDYWELVGSVWTDSENIYQNLWDWSAIWSEDVPDRIEHVMDADDRAFYDSLPDTFPVYRGVENRGTMLGMSWTTDWAKARWFADRWKGSGSVITFTASKSDVLAAFTGRNEHEVVFPLEVVECSDHRAQEREP